MSVSVGPFPLGCSFSSVKDPPVSCLESITLAAGIVGRPAGRGVTGVSPFSMQAFSESPCFHVGISTLPSTVLSPDPKDKGPSSLIFPIFSWQGVVAGAGVLVVVNEEAIWHGEKILEVQLPCM